MYPPKRGLNHESQPVQESKPKIFENRFLSPWKKSYNQKWSRSLNIQIPYNFDVNLKQLAIM